MNGTERRGLAAPGFRRLSILLAATLLLFSFSPANAGQSANDFTFNTTRQGMWGAGGLDRTFTLFDLPFSASGSRKDTTGVAGIDFGYDLNGSAGGEIGLDLEVRGTGGDVDVTYGGSVRIGYPDAWSFQKGSVVTFTTALANGTSRIRTSGHKIAENFSLRGNLSVGTSAGVTLFGERVPVLDLDFDLRELLGRDFGFSLLKLDPSLASVEFLDTPELSRELPANDIDMANGAVFGCGQTMISGDIEAPLIELDQELRADAAGLKASGEDPFFSVTFDLDAIITKVVDKKLPASNPLKGRLPCYVHGEASVSAAGYGFSPSYDTLDMKLDLDITERQEFTFQPEVQVTLDFSAPVKYCVTDAGQPAPPAAHGCWTGASSAATFAAGRDIHVVYPEDPSPDSMTVTPSFSVGNNRFRNKTSLVFEEPLVAKAMRFDPDVGKIVVVPEACLPEACILGQCTPPVCTPEAAFPGFDQVGPLYTSNIATKVQEQELTVFDQTWSLGGFQAAPGHPLSISPLLDPQITITSHAPASAAYLSSFEVNATGRCVIIEGTGGCSGYADCTWQHPYPARITMTSGTQDCTVSYKADWSGYVPTEITEVVRAEKIATATTLSSGATSSSLQGDPVVATATVTGGGTGTVTFSEGATTFCVAVPLVGGRAACTVGPPPAGVHAITATYHGNDNYRESSGSVHHAVVSTPLFVEEDGVASGICDSWDGACDMQYALGIAPPGAQIWVRSGVYRPTAGTDRSATFLLGKGVKLYGGFSGTETELSQRAAARPTVLSGDIGAEGDDGDNSYHVVTVSGADNTTVLDGFTVTGGNAGDRQGGGIHNSWGSPVIANVTLSGNSAAAGGGMYSTGSPTLANVTVTGNTAHLGGGIYNGSGSPTLANVTLSGNTAGSGGGMYNAGSPGLTNCILWGNTGGELHDATGASSIASSIVEGGCPAGATCDGAVLASDPLLDPAGLQYNGGTAETIALGSESPAIDAAEAASCPSTDGRGVPRPHGAACDMGAYEWGGQVTARYSAGPHGFIDGGDVFEIVALRSSGPQVTAVPDANYRFVNWSDGSTRNPRRDLNMAENVVVTANFATTRFVTPTGTGDCLSWGSACGVQDAIDASDPGDEIWVASGTYRPTSGTERAAAFRLKSGVRIYGGFGGTESELALRDPAANPTILSGDIGTAGDDSDNCYHVVDASGTDRTTLLDGFFISGGNANGAAPDDSGGGITIHAGSLKISNVQLENNTAAGTGGALYLNGGAPELSNVTITGNTARYGGGMGTSGGDPALFNVTVTANTAGMTGGGMSVGGGNPVLTNVTMALNVAQVSGSAIYNGGNAVLRNCFVGNNTVTHPVYLDDSLPIYNDDGWPPHIPESTSAISNSIVRGGCPSRGTCEEVTNSYESLGPLGDYGGATQTMPLLPGSPAIDAGAPSSCPATDQRGTARVGTCDIGAFESRGFTLLLSGGDNLSTRIGTDFSAPLSVSVASPSGEPVDGGQVTFTGPSSGAGLASAGPRVISGGVARLYAKANGTGGGPYLVTGSASGAATSAGFHLTNEKLDQGLTVTTHAPQDAFYRGTFDVAATGGASGNPVLISAAGGCSGSGSGSATITMTSGTAACTVVYDQAGNDTYNATRVSETVTAKKLDQAITVTTHAPAEAALGTAFPVAAESSVGELGVAVSTSGFCSGGGTGSATVRLNMPALPLGSCTVHYLQPGDANYNPATAASEVTAIGKGNPAITVTAQPESAAYGASFPVAATASVDSFVLFKKVAIAVSGACGISGTYTKTITMRSGTEGCAVHYNLEGDEYFNSAPEVVGHIAPAKAASALAVTPAANPSSYGETVLTATLPADATGIVTFTEGATTLCSVPPEGGRAVCSLPALSPGPHTITAGYGGDGNYDASAASVDQSVNRGDRLSLLPSRNPAVTREAVTLTASVAPLATGTVTFTVEGEPRCAAVAMDAGTARCETSFPEAGAYTVLAEYSGDGNYHPASQTASQVVIPPTLYAVQDGPPEGFCDSWAGACDLQHALGLAFAGSGAEIWVRKGTYRPTRGTERAATFRLKSGVSVYGGFDGTETERSRRDFAANETILSGDLGANGDDTDNSYHVVDASSTDGTAVLDGFTVTGGYADGSSSGDIIWDGWGYRNRDEKGGGIYIHGGSPTLSNLVIAFNRAAAGEGGGLYSIYGDPVLTGVRFSDNAAEHKGGGMYSYQGSPVLTEVTFSGNSASAGGGLYIDNSDGCGMTRVTFSGNSASEGGGIYNYGSSCRGSNLTFSGNRASSGGGMYNWWGHVDWNRVSFDANEARDGGGMWNDTSSPSLTNATFSGNSATADEYGEGGEGGAIYNYSYSQGSLTNATFKGNRAAKGGGMYNAFSCSPSLTNVTFSGNSAVQSGGAIYNLSDSSPSLNSVTMSGNSAAGDGGGMANYANSEPAVVNSILWGNTAASGAEIHNESSSATIGHSIVEGGCPAGSSCDGTVLGSDPRLAAGGAGDNGGPTGTIALLAGSPAIDAADGGSCPGADQRGIPRPQGAACDMGAFESGGFVAVSYAAGQNGFLDGGPVTRLIPYGADAPEVRATPAEGHHFAAWSDGSTDNPRGDKEVTGEISVSAEFAVNSYSLTYSAGPNGAISGDRQQTVAYGGSGSEIEAVAAAGYHFVNWSDGSPANPRVDTNVTADVSSTASFAIDRLYVKKGGLGSGLCQSWSDACDLQHALGIAGAGTQIWVQAGTYLPTPGTDRFATFRLKDGAALFGGFGGTESDLSQRDGAANPTILSGDIGVPGEKGDNCHHVVTGSGTGNATLLDGFTISGGHANGADLIFDGSGGGMLNVGGSPTLSRIVFSDNYAGIGGGMCNYAGSDPVLIDVVFSQNSANAGGGMLNFGESSPRLTGVIFSDNRTVVGGLPVSGGGGMFNDGGTPELTNVTFSGNSADYGGAIYNDGSSPVLENVTISGNRATDPALGHGGGMYNTGASGPVLKNAIVWGNQATFGAQIHNETGADISAPVITHSIVEGGAAGTGNLGLDPLLGSLGDHGGFTRTFPLRHGSPAIGAGDGSSCPASDQRGLVRAGRCDIGAYQRGVPAALAATAGTPQSVVIGGDFAAALEANVVDAVGGPLDNIGVFFAGPASGAGIAAGGSVQSDDSGVAAFTPRANGTAGGPYTVTAATGALSAGFTLTNGKGTPVVSVTGGTYTYNGSPRGPVAADVTTGGSTGSVTMSYAGTGYGPSATPPVAVGSYTATATVAGDGNHHPATSAATAFSIVKGDQTIGFDPPATVTYGDPPVTLHATGGASGNPVVFALLSGPGSLRDGILTITGVGDIIVTASQAGSADYNPAVAQRTVVVAPAPAPIDGACGESNGGAFTAAPTTGLCVKGTASEVSDSGAWTCDGSFGGSVANCSATILPDETGPTLILSTLPDNAVTNNATLNISGSVTDPGGVAGLTVNNTSITVTGDRFSTAVVLQPGANIITTVATDGNGNVNTDTRVIILDTNAPALTLTAPADNSATNEPLATLSGSIDESCTVTVKVNGAAARHAEIDGTGYSATVNLGAGLNNILVTATDPAGNSTSLARSVTLDTDMPSLAVTVPDADLSTDQSEQTVGGTVGDVTSATTVAIAFNGQTFTPAVLGGRFSQALLLPSEGSYTLTVTATDAAGNSTSVTRNIIYALKINGSCGTSDGQILTAPPADGLCATGTASDIFGSGPWSWSCGGTGATASCSAGVESPPVPTGSRDGIINPGIGKTIPDISDALILLRHVVGIVTLTGEQASHADVAPLGADGRPQGDGALDIADVIIVLRRAIGLGNW